MKESILMQEPYPDDDKAMKLALMAAEKSYRLLIEHVSDVVVNLDEGGMIVSINQAIARYGYHVDELIGQSIRHFIDPEDRDIVTNVLTEAAASKEDSQGLSQFRMVAKTGRIHWVDFDYAIRFGPQGQFLFMQGICRPVVEWLQDQNLQARARDGFNVRDGMRPSELMRANEELHKELLERRETERALRSREADLELEKANLEETNTALRVLLKRREVDKHDFEEQVMYNVKDLILPYIDKLKALTLDERQNAYLSILESNLNDISKAFSRRLSIEFYHLTPSELKVANFIRQGKKSREIASLLGLSQRTIDACRLSIRRKLRIKNKQINLRTFLSSIN